MSNMISLKRKVAAIGDLPRDELVLLWQKAHDCPPPKGVKRGLLERSASWHLQARRLGGLSASTKRILRQAQKLLATSGSKEMPGFAHDTNEETSIGDAGSTDLTPSPSLPRKQPIVGTRLIREWDGRTNIVEVTEAGLVYDGKTYRSLSAVAKRITGAHWSGPRFFGL